jgi:excinuclease UvrABC ATPase subunit
VFTGVSGSGKSSLAFGTLYAEAQRRYLESVSPYARRLFHQMAVPEVDEIEGLPPAVALKQQRGSPTTRSSVGSVTTLSNPLRMLYSRAGDYLPKQPLLYAESFSTNTPEGVCPNCHCTGRGGDVASTIVLHMPVDIDLDYRIDAFSFDASPVDFRARPLAKILMSSDLPLPIKRPNSSAVNGMFSSRTLGRPAPKNSLNQRPNRCIEDPSPR